MRYVLAMLVGKKSRLCHSILKILAIASLLDFHTMFHQYWTEIAISAFKGGLGRDGWGGAIMNR